jgi:hypothetical protein
MEKGSGFGYAFKFDRRFQASGFRVYLSAPGSTIKVYGLGFRVRMCWLYLSAPGSTIKVPTSNSA